MNQINHNTIWGNCLEIIKVLLDNDNLYNLWFKPIKAVSFENSVLTLELKSDFVREYLEDQFDSIFKHVLKRTIGPDAKLSFMVRQVSNQSAISIPANIKTNTDTRAQKTSAPTTSARPSANVYPGLKNPQVNSRLKKEYSFENFVQGDCNKLAVLTGMDISEKPGVSAFNPLFIYGKPGLGKTHLAQAIGNSIKQKFPDLNVLYVTASEFKLQYMQAGGVRNMIPDFLMFYMNIDVLIMDDIQDLVAPGTQNAFFTIFNRLHSYGKQLIFTSDRPQVELNKFEERILSRLKWGSSIILESPSFETRYAMLKHRCSREGVEIADNVLEYIAKRIKTNFRELEGALMSLLAYSINGHQEITIELAEKTITGLVSEDIDDKKELNIEYIVSTVSDYFSLSKDELLSKSRKREIVQARQIAMYLCRNYLNCSLSKIGEELGGKDHSTVMHACTQITDLIGFDRNIKKYVNEIEKNLVTIKN